MFLFKVFKQKVFLFASLLFLLLTACQGSVDETADESQLGTVVIVPNTIPENQPGVFEFSGDFAGAVPSNGSLVTADTEPGMYKLKQEDPAPDFDLTGIDCDDKNSPTPSISDLETNSVRINLDPGETITCTFINTQRGTVVVSTATDPEGQGGIFEFTGTPFGAVSSNGTLVVANLKPGMYETTQADPAPDYDLTEVDCDDNDSPTPSVGDANSREAVFNVDPGETVTCTFVNTQRGTVVVSTATDPEGQGGIFEFMGTPFGAVSSNGTLVVANLKPGMYETTQVDPAPDYFLTNVDCDDSNSHTPSVGDIISREAVFNLDPGEIVTCIFVNTKITSQFGIAVVSIVTDPEGVRGIFNFTGTPFGAIPSNGTLVTSNLDPGVYKTTQEDPTPDFDLTEVSCDDDNSPAPSIGNVDSREATFNIGAGEIVTCTFVNTRRGTAVVHVDTETEEVNATYEFTGVPAGTIVTGGTLVVANLVPGEYKTVQLDPGIPLDVISITCDDTSSDTPSIGDASTQTATFNIDPGEMVTCTFVNSTETANSGSSTGGGTDPSGGSGPGSNGTDGGINPFSDPEIYLVDFPVPSELPPDAGTVLLPLEGDWRADYSSGTMTCGGNSMSFPAANPETGTIAVSEDGKEIKGTGFGESGEETITLIADPEITGRFTGAADSVMEGEPVTVEYYWQVVDEENIIGYLIASSQSGGVSCRYHRPFEIQFLE